MSEELGRGVRLCALGETEMVDQCGTLSLSTNVDGTKLTGSHPEGAGKFELCSDSESDAGDDSSLLLAAAASGANGGPALRNGSACLAGSVPGEKESAHEQAVLRKVHVHLLSRFFTLTLLCYLDRTNLSFAALQMNEELGFTPDVYGLASGLFYLGYFCSQLPSNMALQAVGAPRWLAAIVALWGVVAMSFAFIKTAWQFYVMRILLGIAEGGTFPGMYYHLSCFCNDTEMGSTYSIVLFGIAISQVVGGPIAALLLLLDGCLGLAGWQWLFVIEGIPTILAAAWIWMTLAPSPEGCMFLQPQDRDWLVSRMAAERRSKRDQGAQETAMGAVWEPRTWGMCASGFLFTCAKYGVMYWAPLLIRYAISGGDRLPGDVDPAGRASGGGGEEATGNGDSGWHVALLTSLPYTFASLVLLANTWHSKKTGETRLHVVVPILCSAGGFALLPLLLNAGAAATIAGLMLTTMMMSSEAIFMSWMAVFLQGPAAAAGVAIINSCGNLGGVVGPYLIGWVKVTTGSFGGSMQVLGLLTACSAAALFAIHRSLPGAAACSATLRRGGFTLVPDGEDEEEGGAGAAAGAGATARAGPARPVSARSDGRVGQGAGLRRSDSTSSSLGEFGWDR